MAKNKDFFILAILIVAISFGGHQAMKAFKSRGLRLNNPSNIRHGIKWDGMAADQPDSDFVKFISPEFGIRAMYRNLLTYRNKYGLNTIAGIINRWAPPSENSTSNYINFVSRKIGVAPTTKLSLGMYPELMKAMITMENGEQPYTNHQINEGIRLA